MSSELVETSRLFARRNAAIKPDWIEEAAGHLVSRSYSEPHWSAKPRVGRGDGAGDPVRDPDRRRPAGRLRPDRSRAVARAVHPRQRWSRATGAPGTGSGTQPEPRCGRPRSSRSAAGAAVWLIDDEAVFAFYDARIPADVTSVRHFDSWWKRAVPHAARTC